MKYSKFRWHQFLIIFCVSLSCITCVNVNLEPKKITKSKNYKINSPQKYYDPVQISGTDAAWRDKRTQSTFSIITECGTSSTYKSINNDVKSVFDSVESEQNTDFEVNGLKGKRLKLVGLSDNKPTYYEQFTYIDDSCSYIISQSGPSEIRNNQAFEDLIRSFRIAQ